ncbi:MAG: sugar-binding protein [Bryobacteraceae bacterium]
MRLPSFFLAAILAASPLAGASPYSWATWYATKRTVPITIDGDLSDWNGAKGFTLDQEKFFFVGQGMSSAKWRGPSDLSATFKVQWDSDYLYVAVAVTDARVTEPHGSLVAGMETGSWDDDGVEIMLDNDGCGMPRYYIGDPVHHEFHFVYSAKHPFVFDNFWKPQPGVPAPEFKLPGGGSEPLAYPGEVMAKNDITSRFASPPYDGAFAFRRTALGYNLEVRMRLPGAKMRAVNEGGAPLGFDLAINDNDEGKGALKQQLHWSGVNDMFWRNCQFFGRLIFINR